MVLNSHFSCSASRLAQPKDLDKSTNATSYVQGGCLCCYLLTWSCCTGKLIRYWQSLGEENFCGSSLGIVTLKDILSLPPSHSNGAFRQYWKLGAKWFNITCIYMYVCFATYMHLWRKAKVKLESRLKDTFFPAAAIWGNLRVMCQWKVWLLWKQNWQHRVKSWFHICCALQGVNGTWLWTHLWGWSNLELCLDTVYILTTLRSWS